MSCLVMWNRLVCIGELIVVFVFGGFIGLGVLVVCMSYDKATVRVRAEHDGVVSDVRDLVSELHEPEKFIVQVVDESFYTEGAGTDGSKVLTVDVHEYVGEIPLLVHSVEERVDGAEIVDVENERGASEVEGARE